MGSETNKEYSVNWKNHMIHIRKAFDDLLNSNELTDVTLCCEGKKIGAHKMLLSACSQYFRDIFKDVPCQHPVIILYGVDYAVLADILHFIYNGEVSVDTTKLDLFLKTAQHLQISGLTDDFSDRMNSDSELIEAGGNEQHAEKNVIATTEGAFIVEPQRGTKRQRAKEAVIAREKATKQENDMLFITDVKCEPSELVNFSDPAEDPLRDQQESGEFFGTSAGENSGEEEFKKFYYTRCKEKQDTIRGLMADKTQRLDGKLHVLSFDPTGKRRDCVVCSNRKIAKQRRVTGLQCETCSRRPNLHVGDCFRKYHTQEIYKSYKRT